MPVDRLRVYATWSPFPLEIAATISGNWTLEHRFHALFIEHHSHHEWFHAAPIISETIEDIRAGTFDVSSLPEPKTLWVSIRSPESIAAAVQTRKAWRLHNQGKRMPDDVMKATFTYQIFGEELQRRRAIVRAFVEAAA